MIFSMIISIYANINYIMIKIMITVIDEEKENEKELKKIQKKAMKRRNRNYTKKNEADEKNSDNEDEDDDDDDDDDDDIRNSSETFYRPCPLISTAAVHIGRYFLLFGGFNNRLRERSEIWVSTNVKAFYTYCII